MKLQTYKKLAVKISKAKDFAKKKKQNNGKTVFFKRCVGSQIIISSYTFISQP